MLMRTEKGDEYILAVMIDGSGGYSTNMTDKYRLERILLERQGWRYFKLYSTKLSTSPLLICGKIITFCIFLYLCSSY